VVQAHKRREKKGEGRDRVSRRGKEGRKSDSVSNNGENWEKSKKRRGHIPLSASAAPKKKRGKKVKSSPNLLSWKVRGGQARRRGAEEEEAFMRMC